LEKFEQRSERQRHQPNKPWSAFGERQEENEAPEYLIKYTAQGIIDPIGGRSA